MQTKEQLELLTKNALLLANFIWLSDCGEEVAAETAELLDVLRSMRQLIATDDLPLTRYRVKASLTLYGSDHVYAPSSAMAEEYMRDYFTRYIMYALRNLEVREIKVCASRS